MYTFIDFNADVYLYILYICRLLSFCIDMLLNVCKSHLDWLSFFFVILSFVKKVYEINPTSDCFWFNEAAPVISPYSICNTDSLFDITTIYNTAISYRFNTRKVRDIWVRANILLFFFPSSDIIAKNNSFLNVNKDIHSTIVGECAEFVYQKEWILTRLYVYLITCEFC